MKMKMTQQDVEKWAARNLSKRLMPTVRTTRSGELEMTISPGINLRIDAGWDESQLSGFIEQILNAMIGELVVTAHGLRGRAVSNTIAVPQPRIMKLNPNMTPLISNPES